MKKGNYAKIEEAYVKKEVSAAYTVEAAWVMAVVLFTFMVMLDQAFRLQNQTTRTMEIHQTLEQERHKIQNIGKSSMAQATEGNGWSSEITVHVFRPEEKLRMWSLLEDIK